MRKMYEVAIERKTTDGEYDFLQWLDTYMESPKEVENTEETVKRFTLDNLRKDDGMVHALFIEDPDEWVREYYVFRDPNTLVHYEELTH